MKTYDTVYRQSETQFTGVPIAKLHKGHWYWPDYETARDFATANNLPTSRIVSYTKGWAIQLHKSGPYVGAPKATKDVRPAWRRRGNSKPRFYDPTSKALE